MSQNLRHIRGGWVIHHDQKLEGARSNAFDAISVAGRATRLLSSLSKEVAWSVSMDRVVALAATNGIKRHEVRGLLDELKASQSVMISGDTVTVLAITQANLFNQANSLFEQQTPSSFEAAALDLSEMASQAPVEENAVAEEIGDNHQLASKAVAELLTLSKTIGFVDYEDKTGNTLLFNGSLFKRDNAEKARIILSSLDVTEKANLTDVEGRLDKLGCLPEESIKKILGDKLWSKLHQIGYFQVSAVTNERGSTTFVSRPSALVKYVPGGLADMHDDAKALASSLTYGILKSDDARGRIRDPELLLNVLINRGYVEGRARALIQDYQPLERRGVVSTESTSNGYRLTLNKKEVGRMAKDLILKGDATAAMADAVIVSNQAMFVGPEVRRVAERKVDVPESKLAASEALEALRKAK